MKKSLKYLPLILILFLGLFLRIYKFNSFFNYTHDNDLASWIIKDILVNHHLRLIGQQTSVLGVFIGALFYYLQIPFYLIGKMDPRFTVFLSIILGTFSVFSVYFVFTKVFSKKIGLIGALIFASSQLIVFLDREVVPTMPVMLWTVWFFYDLYLIYKGKQKLGFILLAVLVALIWHLNMALYVITPLAIVAFLFSKKKIQWKYFLLGVGLLLALNSPLIFFETKHNFQQTRAVVASLTTDKNLIPQTSTGLGKLDRVLQLVEKNTSYIFFPSLPKIPVWTAALILSASFLFLANRGKISKYFVIIFLLWQLFYIGFFTMNSLNLSEYYLSGMNIIWIAIASLALAYLSEKKYLGSLAILLIVIYSGWNTYLVVNYPYAGNGYLERRAIVDFIKKDSLKHNYPCVSVSYITGPGYQLGYRYFFYLEKLHVNQPKSGSPVYSIVFPLSLVDNFDVRFGSLGLVLPDYQKYDQKQVEKSCKGADSNLTDPMFGYTE